MEKVSKNTIDYYIQPNKILCSMYGLWPSSEKRSTIKNVLSVLHLLLSVMIACSVLVPELLLISSNWRDISIVAGAGSLVVTVTQFLFKTAYLVAKKEKACRLLDELRSLWNSTDDPEERKSYEVFAYWGRTCTIAFFVSGMSTTSMFMVSAALDSLSYEDLDNTSNRYLPYDIWHEMEYPRSPEFELLYAGQIMSSFISCFGLCGLDGMCLSTILQVSGQFRLITTWLNNIGLEMKCKPIDLHNCPVKLTADLVRCIRHHQRLINVVEDVNTLLAPIIFIQLLTGGIQICLSGLAVLSNDVGDDLVIYIAYLASVTIQIVMYCWPGEILIQESQKVGHAAYSNVPWYQLPIFYRRQLLLIIVKSQKYCCLSALTFKALSSHTLTNVFNTGSSYFALLRKLQEQST